MNPDLPQIGDVVARKYRIEKIVGEGGMGIVFAAHHLMLDQRVALKVLLVDAARGEEIVERFVREAQAAARVKSDHVVRVMDAGSLDSGLPFLVMEYLEGCDLDDLLVQRGPLDPIDVCDYMLQVLAALAQAHAAGIVHRDLKPANIFLRAPDGGPDLVKILDFGISKQESEREGWKQLTGQTCLGTPAYMSPEQLRSSKSVDARADLWSLGVLMYELLTQKLPFDGESPTEIFAAILEQTPAPLSSHRDDIPEALSAVITRALQRNPDDRFADAGEFARALGPLSSGRWEHLLEETTRSAGKIRKATASSSALIIAAITAANVAANASVPPPIATHTPLAFNIAKAPEAHAPVVAARAKRTATPQFPRLKVAFAVVAASALVVLAMRGQDHSRVATARGESINVMPAEAPTPPSAVTGEVAAPVAPPAAPVATQAKIVSTPVATAKHAAAKAKAAVDKRAHTRPTYVEWKD